MNFKPRCLTIFYFSNIIIKNKNISNNFVISLKFKLILNFNFLICFKFTNQKLPKQNFETALLFLNIF